VELIKVSNSIGLLITMISFTMLFATLFLYYALIRVSAPVWPPMGVEKIDVIFPKLSTFFILMSSVSYELFRWTMDGSRKNKTYSLFFLVLTLLLGGFFLVNQFKLWSWLEVQGYFVGSGIYSSIIYAFTWVHSAHILIAFSLMIYLLGKVVSKDFQTLSFMTISNVRTFWHFLGIIWIIMYLVLFIL
jgi:cytochrome c oxidase subunit 3